MSFVEISTRLRRRFPDNLLIAAREVRAGIVPDGNGNFRNGKIGGFQKLFRRVATDGIQEFHNGATIFLLKGVRDIVLVQEKKLGNAIKRDIILIVRAKVQVNLAQRIRLREGIEGKGDQIRVP